MTSIRQKIVRSAMLAVAIMVSHTTLAQHLAVKTNLIYDALLTPSLGAEFVVGKHCSLDVMSTYNRFGNDSKKWRNYSFQPELRWWPHRSMTGPFLGISGVAGGFNLKGINIFDYKGQHRQGHFYGGGISVGWHQILSTHFSLEYKIGGSFVCADYERIENNAIASKGTTNRILPIGTGISLVYVIK